MAGDRARERMQNKLWRRLRPGRGSAADDEGGRLEYEMTMLQEMARVLSSTLDLESVYAALVRTAALIVSSPDEPKRRSSLLRLDGDTLVSIAEWDEQHAGFTGSRYDLAQFARMREIVNGGRIVVLPLVGAAMPEPILSRVRDTGLQHTALAPLTVGGEPFGVLVVAGRDPKGFDELQLRRLEAVGHIGELAIANARSYAVLATNAATDSLTGLKNRREFERLIGHQPREGYAVLAIDVDNLKPINDEHGHEAGDAVLRAVAAVLTTLVRTGDALARVGGDEFATLLMGATLEEAERVAERMRGGLHETNVPHGQARISIGCAAGSADDDPHDTWRAADKALYAAKRGGRDRVESER